MTKLKRRANLLYKLRRHGVKCNTQLRMIYIPYGNNPFQFVQVARLCHEFHFNIQYVII